MRVLAVVALAGGAVAAGATARPGGQSPGLIVFASDRAENTRARPFELLDEPSWSLRP